MTSLLKAKLFIFSSLLMSLTMLSAAEDESIEIAEKAPEQQVATRSSSMLGMNVRANKESALTLTIVPWRSAQHKQLDPEISPVWQPNMELLQPKAYRREINAFLRTRNKIN